jgi:hypothetical protein
VQRTVRFIAKIEKPSTLEVKWDGRKVFSGEVESTDQQTSICEWQIDINLFGLVPLEIHVRQGAVVWSNLHMNYSGIKLAFPGSQPLGYERIVPKDYFAPPGAGELKKNVKLNGESVFIDRQHNQQGSWHYTIQENQTLTCDFYIDRKRTMLYDPRA